MNSSLGYVIVSGRWDDNVAIVDVEMALSAGNDGLSSAVVCRPRVTPDIDTNGDGMVDAQSSGQPVAVVVDSKADFAYVINHSGPATREAAARFQHGHPGLVAVLNVRTALDSKVNGTLDAIEAFIPTGRTGPVGSALTPDGRTLLVNCGEAEGSEDGGDEVTAIDVATRTVSRRIPLELARRHPATAPSTHDSPHPSFGRYPNPTGLVVSPLHGGVVFVGNGGFSDVSVLDLTRAMAGDAETEICRVPVETGPFGLGLSPKGELVAVAARESMSHALEGKTISLISVELAVSGREDAEIARVNVGSDNPDEQTRPFAAAFTPDGKYVVASCFRSNSISFINVEEAIAG
ncbi:MAG: YncE family protein, partial [Hyphomicrobiaceae bacterium]